MDAPLYLRLRTVCCHEWGCPPWEFDAAVEDGRLAIEDIFETLIFAAYTSPSGAVLWKYLNREAEHKRKAKQAVIRHLVLSAWATKDKARKEEIAEKIRDLQRAE